MQSGNTFIRGVLELVTGQPTIKAKVHGALKPLSIESSNVSFSNDITVKDSTKTNKIILSGSYGTEDPPADGVEGQIYFKII